MTDLQSETRKYIDQIQKRTPPSYKNIKELLGDLRRDQYFGDARKLLGHYRIYYSTQVDTKTDPEWRKLTHWYSLCTYKDVDLAPAQRFDAALAILGELGDLTKTEDQETLGQAGGIFKSKWETYNQKDDLDRSCAYYMRGYKIGDRGDGRYTYVAINAAFLLDLLALQEARHSKEGGGESESAVQRRAQAQDIRRKVVGLHQSSPESQNQTDSQQLWWDKVTWTEAYFGLGDYGTAASLLEEAGKLEGVDDWQKQATIKQLATLSEIQAEFSPDREETLAASRKVLSKWPGAIDWSKTGKVGLALSGGGFRASLFHIGVLARLAECDVLRHIDVLSCVSGGSIVGAHYYLELRNLLATTQDTEIKQQDYIDLVKRLEDQFVRGVQTDVRTKAVFSLRENLKAAFSRSYTITDYIGQLFEDKFYKNIPEPPDPGQNNGKSGQNIDGYKKNGRPLSTLLIRPKGDREDFYPRRDNWRRKNRVPMLVLNATTLNTGHIWQFTAAWMGEPVAGADAEVDRNFRLKRIYYTDEHQNREFNLGRAVAASSGVPGLFEPVELDDLYEGITVRLADGGVHDNQGTATLLQEGCSVILVSDASGQMTADNQPSSGTLSVVLRSNSVLQARVRESGFDDLEARKQSSLLRGLMFLHLRKELEGGAKSPIGHAEQSDPVEPLLATANGYSANPKYTSYGIDRQIQQQLSAIRTDLDAFSDTEAYALMCSGYAMAKHDLQELSMFEALPVQGNWRFLKLLKAMKPEPAFADWNRTIKDRLRVSNRLGFKVWSLAPLPCIAIFALLMALALVLGSLLGVGTMVKKAFALTTLTAGFIGLDVVLVLVVGVLLALCAGAFLGRARRIVLAVITIPGSVIGIIHRHIYDQLFLRVGSLDTYKEPPPPPLRAKGVGAGQS